MNQLYNKLPDGVLPQGLIKNINQSINQSLSLSLSLYLYLSIHLSFSRKVIFHEALSIHFVHDENELYGQELLTFAFFTVLSAVDRAALCRVMRTVYMRIYTHVNETLHSHNWSYVEATSVLRTYARITV